MAYEHGFTIIITSVLLIRIVFEVAVRFLRSRHYATLSNPAHLVSASWHVTRAFASMIFACTSGRLMYDLFIRYPLLLAPQPDSLIWGAISTCGLCGVYLAEMCLRPDLPTVHIVHHLTSMVIVVGIADAFPQEIALDPIAWKIGVLYVGLANWFVLTNATLACYRIFPPSSRILKLLQVATWNEVIFKTAFIVGIFAFLSVNTHHMNTQAAAVCWVCVTILSITDVYAPYGES